MTATVIETLNGVTGMHGRQAEQIQRLGDTVAVAQLLEDGERLRMVPAGVRRALGHHAAVAARVGPGKDGINRNFVDPYPLPVI